MKTYQLDLTAEQAKIIVEAFAKMQVTVPMADFLNSNISQEVKDLTTKINKLMSEFTQDAEEATIVPEQVPNTDPSSTPSFNPEPATDAPQGEVGEGNSIGNAGKDTTDPEAGKEGVEEEEPNSGEVAPA